LRDFQDNEKSIPTILTTSQKLSTGVDARNIRNIVLMRPINSMIEFKQIIGRGTRLFDGKDYFTIYDFVKAHHHFQDPEWDGEPVEEEACPKCGMRPCVCEVPPPAPCPVCGKVAVRVPERAVPGLWPAPLHLPETQKSQSETGRRQGAQHPAHGGHDLLASRRHADVGAAVHGIAVRQTAGLLPE
jgi:type I restriction enzyme R subunit